MIDIALLGTSGMMPMPDRFLSSMLLRYNGKLILVDCGEGTQVALRRLGWGFKAIDAILFTHYHADHISGLPGMLLTIGNSGREEPLLLMGPRGLKMVVESLRVIAPELPFPVEYVELWDGVEGRYVLDDLLISWINGEHMVNCLAYRFDVQRKGRFQVEKARELGIPKKLWGVIQKKGSVVYEGQTYMADMVMGAPRRGISVSFCTDSRPVKRFMDFIAGSDLFICEGMYGENEKKQKAVERKHMLFSEAAQLAKGGQVAELWLTHFSPSLTEPEAYLGNATEIFQNTVIGKDGMWKSLFFREE